MTLWIAVAATTLASWAMKAAGPALIGDRRLPRWARDCIALLAPALLAALIIIELGGAHWSALNGNQVTGVAVAGVTRAFKAPMLAAIASGVLITALLRLATG
jgi:branched-subunit amino acid transport protein